MINNNTKGGAGFGSRLSLWGARRAQADRAGECERHLMAGVEGFRGLWEAGVVAGALPTPTLLYPSESTPLRKLFVFLGVRPQEEWKAFCLKSL